MTAEKTKLTQKVVREFVRRLGGKLKRNIEFDEYVLIFGEHEYFTSDLDDVVGTARVMQGSHPDIEEAEKFLANAMTESGKLYVLKNRKNDDQMVRCDMAL